MAYPMSLRQNLAVGVGRPAAAHACTSRHQLIDTHHLSRTGVRLRQVAVRADDSDTAGPSADDVERQLASITRQTARKSKGKRPRTRAPKLASKPSRTIPVVQDLEDLPNGPSEASRQQFNAIVDDALKLVGEEDADLDSAFNEAALEQLGDKELGELVDLLIEGIEPDAPGAEGAANLKQLSDLLTGGALEKMGDDQLEDLYKQLLGASSEADMQLAMQGIIPSEEGVLGGDSARKAAEGVRLSAAAGGAEAEPMSELEEGKKALDEIMKMLDEEDMKNDPELAEMRKTFQQLKDLAGDLSGLTSAEGQETLAKLQQQLKEAGGDDSSLDDELQGENLDQLWQDALGSTLSTLLMSSYQFYFDRPLLTGFVEVEGQDNSQRMFKELAADSSVLLYWDYQGQEQQTLEWGNAAAMGALGLAEEALTETSMLDVLGGGEAEKQAWLSSTKAVWESEPYNAVLPQLVLKSASGQLIQLSGVELFKVNSMGGEAIGLALRCSQFSVDCDSSSSSDTTISASTDGPAAAAAEE